LASAISVRTSSCESRMVLRIRSAMDGSLIVLSFR
jgi:hypothetical protein